MSKGSPDYWILGELSVKAFTKLIYSETIDIIPLITHFFFLDDTEAFWKLMNSIQYTCHHLQHIAGISTSFAYTQQNSKSRHLLIHVGKQGTTYPFELGPRPCPIFPQD